MVTILTGTTLMLIIAFGVGPKNVENTEESVVLETIDDVLKSEYAQAKAAHYKY